MGVRCLRFDVLKVGCPRSLSSLNNDYFEYRLFMCSIELGLHCTADKWSVSKK